MPSPNLFSAGDLDGSPVAPPEGRWKPKGAVRIEGLRALFFIFGKSDGWLSKTFSHGDGANVDPAALRRIGLLSRGTMRPVTSLKCACVIQQKSSWVDLRRTSGCIAQASLLCWRRHAWKIQNKTWKGCLLLLVTLRCWYTTADFLRRDNNHSAGPTRCRAQRGKTKNRETNMHADRKNMSQFGVLVANPVSPLNEQMTTLSSFLP